MAIDVTQLRAFVNATPADDTELEACLDATDTLLEAYLVDVDTEDPVPDNIRDRAHLLAAAEMFNQGQAPNGVLNQQYDDGTSAPVRIGADPLRPAYPLLRNWVPPVTIG